jgi:uncharacterized protein DUF5985
MNQFIDGAIAMACWMLGVFFIRFARDTRDRLFVTFAIAFWVWSFEWTMHAVTPRAPSDVPYLYLIRLSAFVAILVAIVQKNRG